MMLDRQSRAVVHRIERAAVAALGSCAPATMLIAVSGGADSSATLIALHERAARYAWRLEAAHLDHGLAPLDVRTSFRDAAEALAGRLGVPFHAAAVDVPQLAAARRAGLEITARQERYRFLARLARTRDADAIVTGHTMDDQAETVLLHLIRGAGVDGLAGMRPRSAVPVADAIAAAPLIRPLLALRRRETEALCRAFGVTPADDPANDQPDLLRNAIRHDLIPRLEALNPRAVEMLAALAGSAAADRDLLEQLTIAAVPRVTLEAETDASAVIVSRRALLREPPALQARVLRRLVASVGGETLSHERTLALLGLLQSGGGRVECGAGTVAEARGDRLHIGLRQRRELNR